MVQTSPTPFDVGRAFVHQYYTLLHQAPQMLHRFYSTDSTFIHGGVDRPGNVEQPAVGPESISRRITDLNLRDCHAKIRQVDSHPTIGDGVVVQVTGELSNNGDPMRRFMQTFVLAPRQPKKYYVQNDIFRYQDEVFDDGSDEADEDDRSSSHIYGDTISNPDKASNAGSSAAVTASQQPLLVTATSRPPLEEHQPLPPRGSGPSMVVDTTLRGGQQQTLPSPAVRPQEHQHTGSNALNGFSTGNVGESAVYGTLGHSHIQQPSETISSQPSPRPPTHQAPQENQPQSNGGNVTGQQQAKSSAQTQQQQQQQPTITEGPRPEGTSYAGIAKLQPAAGPTSSASSTGLVSSSTTRGGPTSSSAAPPSSQSTGVPQQQQQQQQQQQSNAVRPPGVPGIKGPPPSTNRPNSAQQQPFSHQQQQQRSGNYYQQQNNRGGQWNDNQQQDHSPARRSGVNVMTAPNEQQVFVGSLPLDFTKETLIECFNQFGNVLDAKIHTPAHDNNKKNFGFVVFDNAETASEVVLKEHVNWHDIRLNVEQKTQRSYPPNSNAGGNFNNGPQGGGRSSNYAQRGGRGGNRPPFRGGGGPGGNNQRRGGGGGGGGGGQFNNNSPASFVGGDDNTNEYRTNKQQQQ